MPSMGAPELIVIAVILIVIFGAGKLPEVAKSLGKSARELRTAMNEPLEEKRPEA